MTSSFSVIAFVALLAMSPGHGAASFDADEVLSLPLYGKPPAKQWSGFLDAGAGTPGTHLHYWFSHSTASTISVDTPVVLWLNGGPGSSSILGMLQELGPLLINQTGGLWKNPYAWTHHAHVLVLESPAGVGYSYCSAMGRNGSCHNTDKSTAADARAALQNFFGKKFPELAQNPFFITGESYAGVYVPTLSKEILDHAPEIKLTGIAVGDPCTDNVAQADSMDMVWYGHKYGFIQDDEFEFLWSNCSVRSPAAIARGQWGAGAEQQQRLQAAEPVSPRCRLAMRHFLAGSSQGFSQGWPLAWINDLTLYGFAAIVGWDQPGSLNYMTAAYMNREDVRKALHVEPRSGFPQPVWPGPQQGWSYTSSYAACNSAAPKGTPSMIDFYREVSPKLLHGATVYNGDTDPCVSYEGTRVAIERVGFKELPGGHMRPWFFNAAAASASTLKEKPVLFGPSLDLYGSGAQFGGHVTSYEHGLSFVTVHGSGHMVPQFRPRAALRMLNSVLRKQPLAPAYLPEANLTAMSDGHFDKWLDQWTTEAKKAAMEDVEI